MKHLKTRVVGIALAVSMLIGNSTVLAAEGDTTKMNTATPINYGQTVHFEIPYGVGGKWYSFTPSTSGTYNFSSWNYLDDPHVYLYDDSGKPLGNNDDGGSGFNFSLDSELTAGKTYYLWVSNHGGTPDLDVYDFSVSWPGRISQGVFVNGTYEDDDFYGLDYASDSTVELSVTPPEGETYTYKWYTVSVFGEREEIAGATGSTYTVDVKSNIYEVDIFLGDIARTCCFSIHRQNCPAPTKPEGLTVSLGNAGTATTAEVVPFEGYDNLRYLACPS